MNETGSLRLTLADFKLNEFLELGQTKDGPLDVVRAEFERIAEVPPAADSAVMLDLLDAEGSIIDDKSISPAEAERMLGQTIAHARRNSMARLRRFKKRWFHQEPV